LKKLEDAAVALTYDDVLLVPKYSEVTSRRDVDITSMICGIGLRIPIISANMDTITWEDMATAMRNVGGLGILHRYAYEEDVVTAIKQLVENKVPAVPSVGVKGKDSKVNIDSALSQALLYAEAGAAAICLDIAHADTAYVCELVQGMAKEGIKVIVGNIATYEAGVRLVNAGAKVLKVGIGPGAVCSTRAVTGHGFPQLSAVAAVADLKQNYKVDIIADGGIKNSGDIVKALAVGADAVMSGYLFAGCQEAVSKIAYRGMASSAARSSVERVPSDYLQEGVSADIIPTGESVSDIMSRLAWGIKSGLSYSGAFNLEMLRKNAKFVRVTSIGQRENATRL
jgi:IMP dehydrogenase